MIVIKLFIKKAFWQKKQNALKFTIHLFCTFIFINSAFAQSNYEKALEYFGVEESDVVVTDQYTSKKSGVEHFYLKQVSDGIEDENAISSIHFTKDNDVLVAHNKLDITFRNKIKSSHALLSAKEAIEIAANDLGLEKPKNLEIIDEEKDNNRKARYSDAGISSREIPIKLVYYTLKNKSIVLVWKLRITEIQEPHSWIVYVDASSGKIIDKIDMMLSFRSGGCGNDSHSHNNRFETKNTSANKGISTKEDNESSRGDGSSVGSYRVYELPLENPIDDDATRTLVQDPESLEASPNGWLDNSNAIFETIGNNVDAYDTDIENKASGGTTGLFDFDYDLEAGESGDYINAAITNTFYLGNMTHDILYHHGFDEVSGNFQYDNFGNGGECCDRLEIKVQYDERCNAYFDPQPDGTSPHIRTYFVSNRDNSFSSTIFIHEYTHGLSSRLVGGPSNTERYVLNWLNAENLSEGWSDIIPLILTIKLGDVNDNGTIPQGLGNWFVNDISGARPFSVLTEACNADPRNVPYSTDLTINQYTYADAGDEITSSHGVSSIWTSMLWDMTWGLIEFYGFDEDLYNGEGGNNIALNLIIESMKLSPISPGFVEGRDAILLADKVLYNSANTCIIWEAFAKRGLGIGAEQGSVLSITDQVVSFDVPDDCICCSEFLGWANNICPPNNIPNWDLSSVLSSNRAYDYKAENSICMLPGFKADAQSSLAFIAHIGYCIEPSNPLRLSGGVQQNDIIVSIYPNPFSKQTTIEFQVEKEAEVSIFVTDVLGKSVATVASKAQKKAGKHHLTFDGSNLPVGIYYCSIKAGDKTETQKLIITK